MFQHLRKSYGRDSDWAGEVIKMSRFIWASDRESEKADSIKGAKIAEVFETLDGIRSQYEFMAVDSGIVAYRQNGCLVQCLHASAWPRRGWHSKERR